MSFETFSKSIEKQFSWESNSGDAPTAFEDSCQGLWHHACKISARVGESSAQGRPLTHRAAEEPSPTDRTLTSTSVSLVTLRNQSIKSVKHYLSVSLLIVALSLEKDSAAAQEHLIGVHVRQIADKKIRGARTRQCFRPGRASEPASREKPVTEVARHPSRQQLGYATTAVDTFLEFDGSSR